MNATLHGAWIRTDETIHFAARHSLALIMVLSIAAAVLSGIYVAATALATTMAATFSTQETAWQARIVQVPPTQPSERGNLP